MSTVIDEAGQVTITIPLVVRERLGLSAGSMVDFAFTEDGRASLRKTLDVAERIAALKRLAGTLKTDMTTDEIMAMTRGED
jgi:AbrB family looped-hinge helix DNA binding protein